MRKRTKFLLAGGIGVAALAGAYIVAQQPQSGQPQGRGQREARRDVRGGARPKGDLRPALQRIREDEGVVLMTSALSARVLRRDGRVEDLGVICRREVTDAFVEFMVDELQAESSEWGDFKFHEFGEGVTAADQTDTDIETPTTCARVAGSQIEGATAEIYKTVATITSDDTYAITEHGLFSHLSAGTMMDRHVFAAINVTSGDKIEFTYELTCTAAG